MIVQSQLYPENLGLLRCPMCALQDWMPPIPAPPQPVFCFSLQQLSQNTLLFHLQQNAHNLASTSSPSSSSLSMCDNFLSMTLSQALDAQLEVQRKELDCILHFQARVLSFNNGRLKSVLREQMRRQLGTLLKTMEWKALYLMKRKEEDLARATKKSIELEACLKKAEMESQWWERLANANEAMVMDLSNTMEQVKEELIRTFPEPHPSDAAAIFLLFTESPSMSTNCSPKSLPIIIACKHAMVSAAKPEGMFSWIVDFVATTSLLQSLTMIPEHDLCSLRSTAASKLILQKPCSRGLHMVALGLEAASFVNLLILSNLYPLLTVYSLVGSPLQARRSSCGVLASEIWRIFLAYSSEKIIDIRDPCISFNFNVVPITHPPT
ncbi:putative BOI-related E3 ubiquitin-protein ligase 2 isoform X1 [Gossypium australe]|uniref:Putative BOI-related E3 ubiquitin-protein ligase 2 isoform X1 n=1 Tax=Gossypium australe TaxID=47621 RepID=A0A5B6WMK0_9ROSI|nr:putative BOI-related E3 ubiquitin-protein ligase 2 isoform X1 [Gossypium australe]